MKITDLYPELNEMSSEDQRAFLKTRQQMLRTSRPAPISSPNKRVVSGEKRIARKKKPTLSEGLVGL